MKVYSMTSKTGTDFEVYTSGRQWRNSDAPKYFEFIIDDGTLKNYGMVTLTATQIAELALSVADVLEESSNSSSRCGCTVNDGCGEWSDVAALKAYREEWVDGRNIHSDIDALDITIDHSADKSYDEDGR